MNQAWIALGSNLGDRPAILARAVELLQEGGLVGERHSHLYETLPEGGKAEPSYLNAVLQARTQMSPYELLGLLQKVETELGRSRTSRPGPRTCDLDLLALGNIVLEDPPVLTLPHPRMASRGFVLVPLCELDVHWRHPVLGGTAGELLAGLLHVPGAIRLSCDAAFHVDPALRVDPAAAPSGGP